MKAEFFTTSDGKEIIINYKLINTYKVLEESDPEVTYLENRIKKSFPEAYTRLCELYDNQFKRVRRFLKCNFSIQDNNPDIDDDTFVLEFIPCPMRGECADEGVICNPLQRAVGISLREQEVLKNIAQGNTTSEVAKKLFISPRTVETHRKNIAQKLGIHSIAEFTSFAHNHGII